MTLNKHITRNFDANRTNIIRLDGEEFYFEIFKYDKTQDAMFVATSDNNFNHNGQTCWFDGMTGLKSKSGFLKLEFEYEAKFDSIQYRIELLYTNTYKSGDTKYTDARCNIYVEDEVKINNTKLTSNDMTYNRYQLYTKFKKGKNKIRVELSPNLVFYGLIIRKYQLWNAHYPLRNDDGLVPISAETDHTTEFKINTMTATFMYNHSLDELLPPTDANANRSGLVFDYRDEINWYVKNNAGTMERVFGGYISTANVDDKLTTLSLECSDRVIDLDRRYCLSEIKMKGTEKDDKTKYTFANDCLKEFDYYSDAIEFLSNMVEVPLRNNITLGKPLVPKSSKTLRTYKKGKNDKFDNKNMEFSVEKKYVQIRNGTDRNKEQSIVLYNSDKGVLLNDKPNLFINYGMGEEESEYEVVEKTIVVKEKAIAQSVMNQADKSAKGNGDVMVKALWKWIVNNIKHNSKRSGFYQTPAKTLSSKVGNCCCKAELLLDMCNYKGITDLQYVHVHKNGVGGHVFCKINGRIVDPSTSNGWGDYYKKLGTLSGAKYSQYPNKPF